MSTQKINFPPAKLINQQPHLRRCLGELSAHSILAVDTEANSLYAYQEEVCLIQVSSPRADYIIDPLGLDDLAPLGEIFSDPGVEKVFHASEYDINMLWDDFHFEINNLFDTMIAARILGRHKLGLDSLLEERFSIRVNKRFQRADWSKRPLPEDMLRYAQLDTHYLIEIRNWLADRLREEGRWEVAQEDFQRASRAHLRSRREKLPPCWRVNGALQLDPQKAAVLDKLSELRDRLAREKDVPLFKIMGNKALVELAEQCPTSIQEIKSLSLPHKNQVLNHGQAVAQAVREGLSSPPMSPPSTPRPDDAQLARERALKDWRKHKARQVGVNSAVILPRYLVTAVAQTNPQTLGELEAVLEEVPLRFEHYGKEILQAVARA